jgi:hypothetical protein
MVNHVGYVKNANIVFFFKKFEPHLSMVNQLFLNFVLLRKYKESSYLSIAENNS